MISNINICCCDTRLLLLLLIMILFTFDFYHYLFYLFWSLNLFSCSCWSEVSVDVPQWSTLNSLRVSVWIKFDWSVTVTLTQFHNHVMFLGARFSESFFHHWNTETGTNQNHGSEPRAVSAVKIRVSIKNDVSLLKKSSSSTLSARWPSQFQTVCVCVTSGRRQDHSWADSQLQAALTSVHFHLHLPTICQPHVCSAAGGAESTSCSHSVLN